MKKSIGAKTVVYPTPVFIVGTYDRDKRPNVMNAAWGGICCSNPPAVMVALRKATYTYGNIMEQKAFTVSIPSENYLREIDYFGIATGRNEDKFAATGLTPVRSDIVNAPYVGEFPMALECLLIHHLEIGLHTAFIGEILDIKAEERILGKEGITKIEKVKPVLFDPENRRYFATGEFLGNAFSIGKEFLTGKEKK